MRPEEEVDEVGLVGAGLFLFFVFLIFRGFENEKIDARAREREREGEMKKSDFIYRHGALARHVVGLAALAGRIVWVDVLVEVVDLDERDEVVAAVRARQLSSVVVFEREGEGGSSVSWRGGGRRREERSKDLLGSEKKRESEQLTI